MLISNNSSYSLQDVSVTVIGPSLNISLGIATGYAEGAVSVAMTEDKTNLNTGGGGSWMHNLHVGNAGNVTISTIKNSPLNELFAKAYNLQRTSAKLWGKNTIVISNAAASNENITAIGGAFQRIPNAGYAKDGANMDWVFVCGQITHIFGNYEGWGNVNDNGAGVIS